MNLAEGRFLRPEAFRGWEWAERTNGTAAAIIVALTTAGELLLVEQYRIPLGARVIELPAGLVGDVAGSETESLLEARRPRVAARRPATRRPTSIACWKGPVRRA